MAVRPILLLGNKSLYEACPPLQQHELEEYQPAIRDLHDTMLDFQSRYGWGRAIAAPQIGVMRRIVAMHVDKPRTFINPILDKFSDERSEYWEDCMSFPDLVVRVRMPKTCRLRYLDESWLEREARLSEDYAFLLQHEVDHLDGTLAIQRAIDDRSIALRASIGKKNLAWHGELQEES